jgi:hypothetical protein
MSNKEVDFVQSNVNRVSFFAQNPDILNLPTRELPEMQIQKRKKPAKSSLKDFQICGADTETIDGRVWLFSTEFGVWEIDTFADLISVLYNRQHARKWKSGRGNRKDGTPRKATRGYSTKQFFFWNLKFDCTAIFHLFEDEIVSDLLDTLEVTVTAEIEGHGEIEFKIKYLEGKSLSIRPQNWFIGQYKVGVCEWWDISQYYNKMRLNDASKLYLNKEKLERCFDNSILDVTRLNEPEYRDLYREDIETYAILDAILAGELTRRRKDDFVQNGVRFIKPYSLANTAMRNLMDTSYIPTINDYLRDDVLRSLMAKAWTCYTGGWFEAVFSGRINSICQAVDLASAYPYIMYHLPNIERGDWVQGDEELAWWNWTETRKPYELGFAEVTVVFEEGLDWYPLVKKSSLGTLVAPQTITGWFTAEEVIEARKWPHTTFIVGEWFYFREHDSGDRPFKPYLDKVYKMKVESEKGSTPYMVAKILANSIYGKTVQNTDNKTGKGSMFNPFYASTICGGTRARLAELNRLNGFCAISKATDGVIFRQSDVINIPERPLPACYNLGEWEADGTGELVIIMSGVYSMRMEDKVKTIFRGSASYFLRPHKLDGIFGFCEKHLEKELVNVKISKPISAKQARQKSNYTLMNVFIPQEFTIRATGDSNKRVWVGDRPLTFADVLENEYKSRPHRYLN